MKQPSQSAGILYGLGVGPGDPDLITLKAVKILRQVNVIAYPAPMEGESLAREIAAPNFDPQGYEEIIIRTPYLEDQAPARESYDRAAVEIANHLEKGKDVAVLCLGDPFLYGSFMYLFTRLSKEFQAEIVPGVSAITAASAAAALPLASRNDIFTVIPGTLDLTIIAGKLENSDAAVIIKVGRHLENIRSLLGKLGLMENACYVERATMAEEKVLPLKDVKTASYFSMILVHRSNQDPDHFPTETTS